MNKVIHISLKLARICQLVAEIEQADIGYKWCLEQINKKKTESVDSKVLYGVINDWYAQFLLDKGDVNKSLVHLKEAHKICSEIVGENSDQAVLLLNDLGTTSFRAEDMVNAEKYLKEAVSIGQQLEDKSNLGVVQANLGLVLLEKGIVDLAEKNCKEAWHLGKKHDNSESINQASYCLDQIKMNLEEKSKKVPA
ncbi:tetratricopeptide repeat protein 19 homolog, mitochondrial-like isoform X2 [Diabrotica undecimpunctata]|uniref:tetratricopeptide repeat protein 19 homolog, mitochondrial-like isoform X2 n=1 Tax=Diabrotica undecimpunctata TaxID=50387 RepID=UPI003B634323